MVKLLKDEVAGCPATASHIGNVSKIVSLQRYNESSLNAAISTGTLFLEIKITMVSKDRTTCSFRRVLASV